MLTILGRVLLFTFLGIVLLLLLLLFGILFSPIGYSLEAKGHSERVEDAKLKARISWLLGALSFFANFEEGELSYHLTLFGFFHVDIPWMEADAEEYEDSSEDWFYEREEDFPFQGDDSLEEDIPIEKDVPLTVEKKKVKEKKKKDKIEGKKEKEQKKKEQKKKKQKKKDEKLGKENVGKDGQQVKTAGRRTKAKEILDGPRRMYRKASRFLEGGRAGRLLKVFWNLFLSLLKMMLPRKGGGELTFGMSDPYDTGVILAGLGMTMPIHRNVVFVKPDFQADKTYVEGNLSCQGRIWPFRVLFLLLKAVVNKDVRWLLHFLLSERKD